MINFYHRFLPHAALTLQPLYGALKKSQPRQILNWTRDMDTAFVTSKTALAEATMLSHPEPGAHISVTTDASGQAVGAVIEQYVRGRWQPLAFFSKQLRPPGQKYSTFLNLLRSHDISILSNLESGNLNKFHCLCQVIFSAIQFIIEG